MGKNRTPVELFRDFSGSQIPKIDAAMKEFFDRKIRGADMPELRELYALLAEYCTRGGKRLRPLLLLLSCSGYGGGAGRPIVRISAALEIMHSFFLIQDDIIDQSDLRRGEKALHVLCGDRYSGRSKNAKIGEDVALVLGDVCLANVLEIMAGSAIPPRLIGKFMRTAAQDIEVTAWGQTLDILNSNSKRIAAPRETAERIAMMKTAYYTIYYPVLMGCMLAGRDTRKEAGRIRDFALPLGQAFQIRDDILGVFGREERTGKPADMDIREGKITKLVSGALEKLDRRGRDLFITLFTKAKKNQNDVLRIRAMMEASGSLDAAKREHRNLIDTSKRMLPRLSINARGRDLLEGLMEMIAEI